MSSTKVDIKDVIRREYKKCALDPVYFMKKYCYIQHVVRGRMLFDLYPFQEEAVKIIHENDNVITLKSRQLGFSTVASAYSLWLSLFHTDKNIVVIAIKQETAKNIITKCRFAYDNLPTWMRSPVVENNKLNLRFKNGSQIKALSSSGDAGRSEAVSLLIIDEAAHIENADDIWVAAQATLSTGGKSLIISTPCGIGNFFHKTWQDAEAGENNFYPIKLNWRVHPERDQEWADEELAAMGQRGFQQEHEAEFLGSGNTVYDEYLINDLEEKYKKDPVEKIGFDGNLWVWAQPDYTKPYVVSADVSRGDGSDYSACHVFEAESCTQVAEYRGKLDTVSYGHLLVEIATKYNDALLVVENANQGWSTLQTIINRNYKNLFYMANDILVVDAHKHITNRWNDYEKKKVPGFTVTNRNRPLIISKLGDYLRDDSVTIHSSRTYAELMTFIWKNGKPEAQKGYHDDLIMSLAIGLWVRDTSLKMFELNEKLVKKTIEGIRKTSPDYNSHPHLMQDPYTLPVTRPGNPSAYGTGETIDTRWLLG